ILFFFSSRRRHTRFSRDWSSDVCSSDLEELMLRFSTYVRLVKLTLKAPDQDIVNIGFRYSPEASRVFFWELPELPDADYYTVERSEERRVGKGCKSRWAQEYRKKREEKR